MGCGVWSLEFGGWGLEFGVKGRTVAPFGGSGSRFRVCVGGGVDGRARPLGAKALVKRWSWGLGYEAQGLRGSDSRVGVCRVCGFGGWGLRVREVR